MMISLADFAITGTMLTAMCVVLAAVAFVHTRNEGLVRCARWGMALMAILLTVSSAGLLQGLLSDNFTLDYVVQHSEKQLGPHTRRPRSGRGRRGVCCSGRGFWV